MEGGGGGGGDRATISSEKTEMDPENLKVVDWEEFDQELARFCSLSSALNEAKEKKQSLQGKLKSLIQVEAESLNRLNELEEKHEKLEARKMVIVNLSMQYVIAAEKAKEHEKELNVQVRSLLVDGASLSVARKRLQESNDLFPGGKEYLRLKNLLKMLRMRQQYMVSQLSLLYPVKISAGSKQEQELESFPSSSKSGNFAGAKPFNPGSLTILGLHLTMLPFKTMSLFTDKKEAQRSSSALGYIAHAVSLVASYLKVPLRYPVRLGGSRSHIVDYAPLIEPTSSDLSSNTSLSTNSRHLEFPLYLDGQDTTRAAYAVFLLNKAVSIGRAPWARAGSRAWTLDKVSLLSALGACPRPTTLASQPTSTLWLPRDLLPPVFRPTPLRHPCKLSPWDPMLHFYHLGVIFC